MGGGRGTTTAPSTPLLDTYTGAAAAYSMRKLRTAYAGSAVRIRESGGDTELDVGFDSNGDFDTAAAEAHCGANNGFVTKWYDQSGNGNDLVQTTAAAQPKIVNAGTVVAFNGKPTISFDGTDDFLQHGPITQMANDYTVSVFTVCHIPATPAGSEVVMYWMWDAQSGQSGQILLINGATGEFQVYGRATNGSPVNTVAALAGGEEQALVSAVYNPSADTLDANYNGTTDQATGMTYTVGTDNLTGLQLGARFNNVLATSPDLFMEGGIQEAILYSSNESSNESAIRSNINAYYSVL